MSSVARQGTLAAGADGRIDRLPRREQDSRSRIQTRMAEDLDYLPRPGSSWRGLEPILRNLERATGEDRIASWEVAAANRDMRHLGCRTRYRPDGRPFMLAPGEQDPTASN